MTEPSDDLAGPREGRAPAWRLAGRPSQYLQSAAAQGIEWYPWGTEPFDLARRLDRPILLDIGAAWCHWCHVMDEGTYADGEVAQVLAREFVAVKVDRDEHPEVDRRYQRQIGALTGEGGWPLTAFLTPDGEAFLGGTYFPAQDGMGRPGFRRVLREVARIWREERGSALQNIVAARESLQRAARADSAPALELDRFLSGTLARIDASYDPVHAGFGQQTKFPHPTAVGLFLWQGHANGDARADARARETLRRMAEGGMYDQLAGGFHRYSTDEGWHIPHFEKMADDNAALLAVYAEAAGRFEEPWLGETAAGIVAWSREVLERRDGGFGASQDADNAPGDDGGYFTWSRAELKSLLTSDELRVVGRHYGLDTDGRMPHEPAQNVLFRMSPIAEVAADLKVPEADARAWLEAARGKMRVARARRAAPAVDTALYASLNGTYLRGLAAAYRALGDPSVRDAATAAADRFLREAYRADRGVAHRIEGGTGRGFGLLEDQVAFGLGLAELAAVTVDRRYADAARELADLVDREFRDPNGLLKDIAPGLYDGPIVGTVGEPSYPLEDHPHLAANAAWALLQIRLSALLGEPARLDAARRHLETVAPKLAGAGLFGAGTALAYALSRTPSARVVVEGTGPEADRLARVAETTYHPRRDVFRGIPPAPFSLPEELASASDRGGGTVRALVCFGTRCLAPITDPAALRRVLSAGPASAAP